MKSYEVLFYFIFHISIIFVFLSDCFACKIFHLLIKKIDGYCLSVYLLYAPVK